MIAKSHIVCTVDFKFLEIRNQTFRNHLDKLWPVFAVSRVEHFAKIRSVSHWMDSYFHFGLHESLLWLGTETNGQSFLEMCANCSPMK